MRRSVTDDEFESQLFGARRYAWRWEQQPAYEVADERAQLDAFLAGHPGPPPDEPGGYLSLVRQMVHERGVTLGRVRVVEQPPTDYQRWLRWVDRWNREAGEDIHYLPRPVLQQMGRPPFAPASDWWLIDGEQLLIINYVPGGLGRRAGSIELVTGEPEVKLARLWRLAVVSWAIEEERVSLPVAA